MPSTYNGTGTAYYGRRDRAPDGSYITTEFAVFAHIPLFPLRSRRVRPVGLESYVARGWFPRHETVIQQFDVRHVPMNWAQVVNVYLVTVTIPLAVLISIWLMKSDDPDTRQGGVLFFFVSLAAFFGSLVVAWLRGRQARRRQEANVIYVDTQGRASGGYWIAQEGRERLPRS